MEEILQRLKGSSLSPIIYQGFDIPGDAAFLQINKGMLQPPTLTI